MTEETKVSQSSVAVLRDKGLDPVSSGTPMPEVKPVAPSPVDNSQSSTSEEKK